MCVCHLASEIPLNQSLCIKLHLQISSKGHEVVVGQTIDEDLVLLEAGPPFGLQDLQPHVSAQVSDR